MGLKNRPKSVGQFLLDLTPLLDVIFILLIVVLTYQNDSSAASSAAARQLEQSYQDAVAAAEGKYAAAQEQLDTYAQMHDYVNVVTIYASYQPSNRKYRTLHVEINENGIWEKEINPSNEERIWDECKAYIETALSERMELPTVFSIQNEKMLYRDEQSILALYEKLDVSNKFEKNDMEKDDE